MHSDQSSRSFRVGRCLFYSDSTQLMIIAQTFKISVAHSGINIDLAKVKLSFSMGIRGEEGGLER